jgi:LysR family transcriptional regulator, nod-box dependent transcriptional activator
MRFKGLDLNLLVALDALLTHQNVTIAAEHVSMSQSAMSGALARLREHFEDELLVPVHRRMVLTPLAQSLELPLRTILTHTSKLLNARSGFDPATAERRFTISCSDYVWAILIVDVLQGAAAQAPGVEICYAGTSSRFSKSDIDLLIAPEGFATENHPLEQLFREEYVCVVWAGNSVVKDTISEKQFFELGHVVAFSERRTFVQEWFYRRYGDTMKTATIAPNFTLVPLSAVGTNHLAVVPLRLAKYYAGHLPLKIIAPPVDIPMMVDVMQWRSYQSEDPGLVWLRDLVKATAKRVFNSN